MQSSNNSYYRYNFQPDYIELNQKIEALTKEAQQKQLDQLKSSPDFLLDQISNQIQTYELQFFPSKIYQTSASLQELNEAIKRGPPEVCPGCGDEIKKSCLCQFCAQMFCKSCCWRKRIIPFNKKENEQKNCCEDCHARYIKLFANQKFFAQKELLVKIIDFTKGKYDKASEKKNKLDEELNQFRALKRNQKIKENALIKEVKDMEKKVKEAQEELQRINGEKMRKKEEEERKKREEERKKQEQKEKQRRIKEEKQRKIKEEQASDIKEQQTEKSKQKKVQENQLRESEEKQVKIKVQNPKEGEKVSAINQLVHQKEKKSDVQEEKKEDKVGKKQKNEEIVQEKVEEQKIKEKKEDESSNKSQKILRKQDVTNSSEKQKDSENEVPLNVREMSVKDLLNFPVPAQSPKRLSRRDSVRESKEEKKQFANERKSETMQNINAENESEQSKQEIINLKNEVFRNSSLKATTRRQDNQNESAVIDNKKCACEVM